MLVHLAVRAKEGGDMGQTALGTFGGQWIARRAQMAVGTFGSQRIARRGQMAVGTFGSQLLRGVNGCSTWAIWLRGCLAVRGIA